MSKSEVKKFNVIVGNAPSQGDLYEVWKQLKLQASLIKEEALETDKAASEEDMLELIDGWADVWVVNTYMEQLLEAFGVDVKKVKQEVCNNNNQKFTTSYTYASDSKEALEEKDVECYIEEVGYEGSTYYTVRRSSDSKVMKLKHHKRPNLEQFVPEEFK